jgi:hypothetical protein
MIISSKLPEIARAGVVTVLVSEWKMGAPGRQ